MICIRTYLYNTHQDASAGHRAQKLLWQCQEGPWSLFWLWEKMRRAQWWCRRCSSRRQSCPDSRGLASSHLQSLSPCYSQDLWAWTLWGLTNDRSNACDFDPTIRGAILNEKQDCMPCKICCSSLRYQLRGIILTYFWPRRNVRRKIMTLKRVSKPQKTCSKGTIRRLVNCAVHNGFLKVLILWATKQVTREYFPRSSKDSWDEFFVQLSAALPAFFGCKLTNDNETIT